MRTKNISTKAFVFVLWILDKLMILYLLALR